ncbi:hypothetical protein [Arthrobacter sp. NPDC092385]|uniref:hypothetical protein n=1 Tax=Arthrobacter sp. NPDC092385 TaxID=3363943 RepID=UPI003827E3A2
MWITEAAVPYPEVFFASRSVWLYSATGTPPMGSRIARALPSRAAPGGPSVGGGS